MRRKSSSKCKKVHFGVRPKPAREARALPDYASPITETQGLGCGVGRTRGIGLPLGVGVGLGVAVGVAVGVDVAVGLGVAVGVGEGLPQGAADGPGVACGQGGSGQTRT